MPRSIFFYHPGSGGGIFTQNSSLVSAHERRARELQWRKEKEKRRRRRNGSVRKESQKEKD